MKKEVFCKECNTLLSDEVICDVCGKQISIGGNLIYEIGTVTILQLKSNSTDYDFCSYDCLSQFITNELTKGV